MANFAQELAELGRKGFEPRQAGAFYGRADKLAPGVGVMYRGVAYPTFNEGSGRYEIRRGTVLVLTHECDLDPANARTYNEYFVFVPLILMPDFAAQFEAANAEESAKSIVSSAARLDVQRLMYLPPAHGMVNAPELSDGALIYWNALASTHISQLNADGVSSICALSQYGLSFADRMFQTHFLRPKSEALPRVN